MKLYPVVILAALLLAPTPGFTQPRSVTSRSGQITVSGSRGQTRSGTYAGTSQRNYTPGQGLQQTYTGQVTGEGGRTLGVDRTSTTTADDQGWKRQSSSQVTGPQGTSLYQADCASQGQRGSASRSCQTTVGEQTYSTSSTATRTSPNTVDRQTTVSQDGQEIGGSQTTATYSRQEGSLTKAVTGQTQGGTPINRTTTVTPNR